LQIAAEAIYLVVQKNSEKLVARKLRARLTIHSADIFILHHVSSFSILKSMLCVKRVGRRVEYWKCSQCASAGVRILLQLFGPPMIVHQPLIV
jgi:hypothetical protein